jgi:hypothetical protein
MARSQPGGSHVSSSTSAIRSASAAAMPSLRPVFGPRGSSWRMELTPAAAITSGVASVEPSSTAITS